MHHLFLAGIVMVCQWNLMLKKKMEKQELKSVPLNSVLLAGSMPRVKLIYSVTSLFAWV